MHFDPKMKLPVHKNESYVRVHQGFIACIEILNHYIFFRNETKSIESKLISILFEINFRKIPIYHIYFSV